MLRFTKLLSHITSNHLRPLNVRHFLAPAYQCHELWQQRLDDPILQHVHLDAFYMELDQRFQKTRNISAVDVDLFAHLVHEESYTEEMLDLIHKLRISADTSNTLPSTHHAVIRCLAQFDKDEQLLKVLNDRLNYGIFLDFYTANLLMDKYWKSGDFCKGSQVASQIMLQEECGHPLNDSLSLLHCYNYLSNPTEWPQPEVPPEPEDEVKVRVAYIRNPYFDGHFDLTDGLQLVGKTLIAICKTQSDILHPSLYICGLALLDKKKELEETLASYRNANIKPYNLLQLIPDSNGLKAMLNELEMQETNVDVNDLLVKRVEEAERQTSDKDIMIAHKWFVDWKVERAMALEKQKERALRVQRLAKVEETRKELEEKETLLWYFENEENIELALEDHQVEPERVVKIKKLNKDDEVYIPPEVGRPNV